LECATFAKGISQTNFATEATMEKESEKKRLFSTSNESMKDCSLKKLRLIPFNA
jgi:hypothetical protein